MGGGLANRNGLLVKKEIELGWRESGAVGRTQERKCCSDKTLGTLYRGRRRRWISFFLLVPISFTIHSVIEAWSPSRLTFSILSFCSWANSAFLTSILPIAGCAVSRHQDQISTTNPNFPSSLSDIEVVAELFEELVSKLLIVPFIDRWQFQLISGPIKWNWRPTSSHTLILSANHWILLKIESGKRKSWRNQRVSWSLGLGGRAFSGGGAEDDCWCFTDCSLTRNWDEVEEGWPGTTEVGGTLLPFFLKVIWVKSRDIPVSKKPT